MDEVSISPALKQEMDGMFTPLPLRSELDEVTIPLPLKALKLEVEEESIPFRCL